MKLTDSGLRLAYRWASKWFYLTRKKKGEKKYSQTSRSRTAGTACHAPAQCKEPRLSLFVTSGHAMLSSRTQPEAGLPFGEMAIGSMPARTVVRGCAHVKHGGEPDLPPHSTCAPRERGHSPSPL